MDPASQLPEVVVIDEGELQDIYCLLIELGAKPLRVRTAGALSADLWPTRLLVAAARRALSVDVLTEATAGTLPTMVAVVDSDAKTLLTLLSRVGFHYVVRRPVHPEALRLLFSHALYPGPERRREPRRPIGYPVRWWVGWRRRKGILTDMSSASIRLLAEAPVTPGSNISLRLPRRLAGRRSLRLRGRVIDAQSTPSDAERNEFPISVALDSLSARTRERLAVLLARHSVGPARLPRPLRPESGVAPGREHRRHPRGEFHPELITLDPSGERAMDVLVGRDLSAGGMRVEPHPSITVGDRLRIALYDVSCREPLVVDAIVIRDDEDLGLGLRFVDLSSTLSRQLERIVATLPEIEDLRPPDPEHKRAVLSRIVLKQGFD
jgi:hypothetical protein